MVTKEGQNKVLFFDEGSWEPTSTTNHKLFFMQP